ncbi:MAG: hypothetical protein H0Z37_08570 [Firmicutes bacterium]|nr:hypothetical protein [Bacillota bacterium]
MPFEFYEPRQSRRQTQPFAQITRRGRIKLNRAATRQYFPSGEFVRLAYDKDAQKVGIVPTDDANSPGAFPVRRTSNGGTSIPAKRFFDAYGIAIPGEGLSGLPVGLEEQDGITFISVRLTG